MDPNFESHSIINSEDLEEYFDRYDIVDYKELNNGQKLLISYVVKAGSSAAKGQGFRQDKSSGVNNKQKNVSISVASSITAYARIFMSKFKNNPKYKIFYTDTDSLYTDKPLDPELIGNKLGQFKLENVFDEAVFLAPKVYGGITEEGEEITKVKGYKNKVSFKDLKTLLTFQDQTIMTLPLKQEKWFKSIERGTISIKHQIYSLSVTENKRNLIWEKGPNGQKLVGTKPFVLPLSDNNPRQAEGVVINDIQPEHKLDKD